MTLRTQDLPPALRQRLPRPTAAGYLRLTRPAPALSLLATIPLRTVNPLNRRDHWAVRMKRAKAERGATTSYLRTLCSRSRVSPPRLPVVVTLTRFGRAMDSDGLAASFKHVRDGVQDLYGVDDGSPLFRWVYAQAKGKACVRVEIQPEGSR